MSKFKVGDPVMIVPKESSDRAQWLKEGIILEVGRRWDGVDLYTTDIPNSKHFGALHLATEDELVLVEEAPVPDTTEYTLENWSTRELLEELLRRNEKNV